MLFTVSAAEPPSFDDNFESRINGPDRGLINAWLVGLHMQRTAPHIADAAKRHELPPLAYKGGVDKPIKAKNKIGSLWYLAAWQGLRGEDLHIESQEEVTLVCSKTRVPVTFTLDQNKLFISTAEGDDE